MMGRRIVRWAGMALGMALVLPGDADAQMRVHVTWEFGDRNWGAGFHYSDGYVTARIPRVGAVAYAPIRYVRVAGVRIPRGFRPRRGFCRLWYPGVAPGHQPRARRCDRLRGDFRSGVLVVTWRGVLRPVFDRYDRVRYARVGTVYNGARDYARYREDPRYGRFDARGFWEDRGYDSWWGDDQGEDWDDRFERRDDRRERGDRFDDRDRQERDQRGARPARPGGRGR